MTAVCVSDAQSRVLRAIYDLSRRTGFPPTIREIMDETGLASTSTVFEHVRQLAEAGMVVKFDRSARAVRLSEGGLALVGKGPYKQDRQDKQE